MGLELCLLLAWSQTVLAQPSVEGAPKQIEGRHKELVARAKGILTGREPGQQDEARRLLEEARNLVVRAPEGRWVYRSEEADFYWAWLLCQDPAEQKGGRDLFEKILKMYMLSEERKAMVEAELARCASTGRSGQAPEVRARFLISVSQKGGQWSQPISVSALAPPPLMHWDQRREAIDVVSRRLGGLQYNTVVQSRPFLVVGRKDANYLARLAEKVLQPYYRHLAERIGVAPSDEVIYAFVAADHNEFAKLTQRLYQVSPRDADIVRWAAIAYSDPPNNTMMAICGANPANCTSFAHELLHVLNFRSFEDAPWWLYEGIGELYESGDLIDGQFRARVGWRKWDLSVETINPRSLRDLLELSKNDTRFRQPPGPRVEMARARFFCHYLHERGVLWRIYYELRGRSLKDAVDDPSGVSIVSRLAGGSPASIASDFAAWLRVNVLPVQAPRQP